ncbi:hypothetical protein [Actinokineospora fastidiosa]|uniref:Uncharacterized protein n=1 Tax=Actinokineospora fastidiosa TaxID=1816 RepID=A0A918LI58_9PSEU|nr:hypothetical protein [Actinokineospora fastidiosa]GGS54771.1 hypothetical protein GCM10010171_57400 [Actinokineospora fastidiosa]
MTDEPRAVLLAAATEGDDALAALTVLRHAMAWASTAIGTAVSPPPGDTEALELVIALDDALTEADALVDGVPALVDAAVAGVAVADHLDTQARRLAELADRVAVARRERDALSAVSAELTACGAEHERIEAELANLRRLRRLADALPDIRAERDRLAARVRELTSETADAEKALADTAETAVRLSEQQLADLDTRARELLEKLRGTETAWAELRERMADDDARLRAKDAEYAKLRAERADQVAALRAHAAIDADLAERLSSATEGSLPDRVRTMLSDAQMMIDEVDAALGDTLARYDRFVEDHSKVLPWRDQS